MGAVIYSENAVCCLAIFAQGDISQPYEQTLQTLEEYETVFDRHFGLSTRDLRMIIFDGTCILEMHTDDDRIRVDFILSDAIKIILQYESTYFNDEGSYFSHWRSNLQKKIEKAYSDVVALFGDGQHKTPAQIIEWIENYRQFNFYGQGDAAINDDYHEKWKNEYLLLYNSLGALSDTYPLSAFFQKYPFCFEILFRCSNYGDGH